MDKWRERFEKERHDSELKTERLKVRAEQPSSDDFDVDTGVIHAEALRRQVEAQKQESDAPPSGTGKIVVTLVRAVKGWPQAVVAVAVLGLVAWWLWLRR